ncbi:MAG: 3-phosphoshikimate 1-carboxyvinyltransferase [Candidatus Dadabacteria bacterium]|nr:MAG: 3-phosphoshikimate 1-carboxyvinyltransferase [Candidatus Dadabacteria bacterium]
MNHDKIMLLAPEGPVNSVLSVPGSKSFTNRALICAALADGESVIEGASLSDDSCILVDALRTLGIDIKIDGDTFFVQGCKGSFEPFQGEIYLGAAGTAMRFMLSVAALVPDSDIILYGTERMHERPIGPLVDALRSAGADISYQGKEGCPPVRVKSTGRLKAEQVCIDGSVSSQYLSSLLLISPYIKGRPQIRVRAELVSGSYVNMTLDCMQAFGITLNQAASSCYSVSGNMYRSSTFLVEADASSASYLWGLAAIAGGRVAVRNISCNSLQGDAAFPYVLEKMGCSVSEEMEFNRPLVSVRAGRGLKAVSVDMCNMPDTAQTLAVVAAVAEGTTVIKGIGNLRYKETDRIAALVSELGKLGVEVQGGPDWLKVKGSNSLHPAVINTYEDHRMAMAFAMLAARLSGLEIKNPQVVTKSFPEFWDVIQESGIRLQ